MNADVLERKAEGVPRDRITGSPRAFDRVLAPQWLAAESPKRTPRAFPRPPTHAKVPRAALPSRFERTQQQTEQPRRLRDASVHDATPRTTVPRLPTTTTFRWLPTASIDSTPPRPAGTRARASVNAALRTARESWPTTMTLGRPFGCLRTPLGAKDLSSGKGAALFRRVQVLETMGVVSVGTARIPGFVEG